MNITGWFIIAYLSIPQGTGSMMKIPVANDNHNGLINTKAQCDEVVELIRENVAPEPLQFVCVPFIGGHDK